MQVLCDKEYINKFVVNEKYIYIDILEQRIGFGQQIHVKTKLVGYKDEN